MCAAKDMILVWGYKSEAMAIGHPFCRIRHGEATLVCIKKINKELKEKGEKIEAMLAEPRYKLKWADDPRNINWSKDTNKYGYKMLSKMGWSEGKGLGAKEDGVTAHVKVSKRRENLGLGSSTFNDDNWLSHQDEFSALLSKLNKKDAKGEDDTQQSSLQKSVQSSQRKILYSKFIKSKDLSLKSKNDLACVFGQRSKSTPATPQELSEDEDAKSDTSVASCPVTSTEPHQKGFVTVKSEMNLQEYFAAKMAALRQKTEANSKGELPGMAVKETCCEDDGEEKKTRKRKKAKKGRLEMEECDGIEMKGKKGKKKKKQLENADCLDELGKKEKESEEDLKLEEDLEPKKKKKNSKKKDEECENEVNVKEAKKELKKKNKSRTKEGKNGMGDKMRSREEKTVQDIEQSEVINGEEEIKKQKKKKKKKSESREDKIVEDSNTQEKDSNEKKNRKKKERRTKEVSSDGEICEPEKKRKKKTK